MYSSGYTVIGKRTSFKYEAGLIIAFGIMYDKTYSDRTIALILPFIVLSLEFSKKQREKPKNTYKTPIEKPVPTKRMFLNILKWVFFISVVSCTILTFIAAMLGLLIIGTELQL